MQGKLTIQDIARLAGVSKATVSRVLNHNPSVDPVLSQRVMDVVQEYGFVPNVVATNLARGRTRLIGVIAPPLNWPAISDIMRGVAEYIEDTTYEIVLYSISFERNHSDVLDRILATGMVSGLLAILPGQLSRTISERFRQGLPLIMIDDQEEPTETPWVGIDNSAGAYEATLHLLEQGHQRIAYLQGPLTYHCAVERYQGYCRALQQANLTPDPALIFQGDFEAASGRGCAEELFSRPRESWPTAIFSSNDEMAYGILEIAERLGVRIPEEIALVGFDDLILSAYMRPPLTTIRQPFAAMGRTAIATLLTMIEPDHHTHNVPPPVGDDSYFVSLDHRPIRIQLPTRLIVRASSKLPYTLPLGP